MNAKPDLDDISALSLIATYRSFRRAADELGLSPSTLSHRMRTLETTMGVRLLHRTTRSVSPTQAGQRLITRMKPVLEEFDMALESVNDERGRPSGALRINASEIAARILMADVIPAFLAQYPEMTLDIVTEGRLVDIVKAGFDAGVRLAEAVPQDMIAVPFGGDTRFVTVASPRYIARQGTPDTPDALYQHACIRQRLPSGKRYRWEFEHQGQETNVDVPGVLTLDHPGLMAKAAANDLGIAYLSEHVVRHRIAQGELVTVLDEWCPLIPGLCLYYSGRRHVPSGLQAFIDMLKEQHPL
ncbi:LysR family transcriptional regulator [Kushneria indalinina]|uniref:DNA-binding transcriptional LysR family regulator n=1 Tax=Kushneria indalinina DSM 14324 TaxID=1122140 RepID=A0A3D9E073_9GAMM|nr:LysR family transcriptional regulator [Kushneria indalinina]REC96428.1 DNA-binding transcriptional LysR family regulator [Kushneria indalinina DSM 14324]